MKTLTKTEVCDFLQAHDRFSILTHCRPDGDTVGSAAALCLGLRQLGKTAHVLRNPEITEKYAPFHREISKDAPAEGDTLICVDVAAKHMLPQVFSHLADRLSLRIDHHATGAPFTPLSFVDGNAAACGQLIYDILMDMGITLDVPIANALYTAVSTDTGCFRYANTQPHSFQVAAACAEVSPDLFRLNQQFFDTNSLARLRLQGWLIDNARFSCGGKCVVCALPLSVEQEMGLTEDDMENISGFPRSIEGVCLAATLRQQPDGIVKLSVRAVPGYDAGVICQKFGGGGHAGAAGASLDMPLEQAAQTVAQALTEAMETKG